MRFRSPRGSQPRIRELEEPQAQKSPLSYSPGWLTIVDPVGYGLLQLRLKAAVGCRSVKQFRSNLRTAARVSLRVNAK
jgi:hypothetical protein